MNSEFSGICKKKNYYIQPDQLYPNDPCKKSDFKAACAYGLQKYQLITSLYLNLGVQMIYIVYQLVMMASVLKVQIVHPISIAIWVNVQTSN